jgi:uncharacterized protein
MAILIDGFNLIYKFPDLEEMMYREQLFEARIGLLDKLKEYAKITKKTIRVVFDGKKNTSLDIKSEKSGVIDVYYSLDYSADFLIKEFIKKDINPKMMTVVTSDKDIINFVSRFKVRVQTSEQFADELMKTVENSKTVKLPEKDDDPRVTNEEISFWENLFRKRKSP